GRGYMYFRFAPSNSNLMLVKLCFTRTECPPRDGFEILSPPPLHTIPHSPNGIAIVQNQQTKRTPVYETGVCHRRKVLKLSPIGPRDDELPHRFQGASPPRFRRSSFRVHLRTSPYRSAPPPSNP